MQGPSDEAPANSVLLVELALVLTIIGVLALVSFGALSGSRQMQEDATAGNALQVAEQAIRTFLLREKRLPCPDLSGDGYEATDASGQCPAGVMSGRVPFATLQLEKPLAGSILRYGVPRGPLADLVNPAASPSDKADADANAYADGSARLLDALTRVQGGTPSLDQPYVARLSPSHEYTDCTGASDNPAFVLMVAATEPPASAVNCFSDDPARGIGVLAVGRQELLGWSRMRLAN